MTYIGSGGWRRMVTHVTDVTDATYIDAMRARVERITGQPVTSVTRPRLQKEYPGSKRDVSSSAKLLLKRLVKCVGQIERSKRLVWSPIEVNIHDVVHEEEEPIEIGGQDACMICARRAEIEYIAWLDDRAT